MHWYHHSINVITVKCSLKYNQVYSILTTMITSLLSQINNCYNNISRARSQTLKNGDGVATVCPKTFKLCASVNNKEKQKTKNSK